MTKKNSNQRKSSNGSTDECNDAAQSARLSLTSKILLALLIVIGCLFGLYKIGTLESVMRSAGFSEFGEKLAPVFTRMPAENVLSSGNVLSDVGKIPVGNPGTVPQEASEPAPTPSSLGKPPPEETEEFISGKMHQISSHDMGSKDSSYSPDESTKPSMGPKAVETSVTPVPEPAPPALHGKTKKTALSSTNEQSAHSDTTDEKRAEPPASSSSGSGASVFERKPVVSVPVSDVAASPTSKKEGPAWEEASRSEQFRLPGALLVKIHNYSGTYVNWALGVILDDSESMARPSKTWNPSRLKSAVDFVGKLPGALTPTAVIEVRDFYCGKSGNSDKKKRCLSHMLLEWTGSPFKQIREMLDKANPGGQTDPCAAAAYTVKNDFKSRENFTPRILIVTNGASKCGYGSVLKALEAYPGKEQISVDVLAFGMGKKRHRGYASLPNKTHGILFEVDKPEDIDQALSRYAKVLKTKVSEKVEVRGDKAVTSISLFQEVALAPGIYTVVLPVVEGLNPGKRTLTNVKISPGETNVIDITIKKGHPIVRTGRK